MERAKEFDDVTAQRDQAKQLYENLRKERLEKFMGGFSQISLKLKEMYQVSHTCVWPWLLLTLNR